MKYLIIIPFIASIAIGCKKSEVSVAEVNSPEVSSSELVSPEMTSEAYKRIDKDERIITYYREKNELSKESIDLIASNLKTSIKLLEDKCLRPKTKTREDCSEAINLDNVIGLAVEQIYLKEMDLK